MGWLAGSLSRIGKESRAQELVQQLLPGEAYGAPLGLYFFHILTGNISEAADWMEKAIGQREPGIVSYVLCPLAKPLRESPRWPTIAKMMNLPAGT